MSDQDEGPQYPQYPSGGTDGDGLEAYPRGPEGTPAAAGPTPEAPQSITTAVRLMWFGAAISLVSAITPFLGGDDLKQKIADQMRESDPNVTQSAIDSAYTIGIASSVVGALIAVGLWLWMAWKNGQGRSWARIVATVLGGINLLELLLTLTIQETTALSLLLGIVSIVLAAVILVLLWRKESSQYYADVTQSQVIG